MATEYNLGKVVGPGVPTGGTPRQILKKNSVTNFDLAWSDQINNAVAGHPVFVDANGEPVGKPAAEARADLGAAAAVPAAQHAAGGSDPINLAAIGAASNPNLLDNWDFRNPGNQRGQSSYPTAGYTIDRWRNWNSIQAISVNNGHLTFTNSSSGLNSFAQYVEAYPIYAGATLTLSFEVEFPLNGSIRLMRNDGTWSYDDFYFVANERKIVSLTFTVSDTPERLYVGVQTPSAGVGIKLYRAKLEIGDVSTLAADPPANYGEQLALCQRYQCVVGVNERFRADLVVGSGVHFTIPIPVTLRANPVIATGAFAICTLTDAVQTGFTPTYLATTSGVLRLAATKTSHGLTDAILKCTSTVVFDANL